MGSPSVAGAPPTAEAVVVGGGIVGAATAFALARAGVRPVLVEREPDLAARTTAVSAHSVRAQFTEPENVAMMRAGLAFYGRFAEELGLTPAEADIGFTRGGYLFASAAPDAPDTFRRRVAAQHALGLADVECLDGAEVRRRFPWMAGSVTAAAFRQGDGWLDGRRATELLVRASGAPLLLGTAVRAVRSAGGRVTGVATDRGEIATGTVVLATGPFAPELEQEQELAGEPLPVAPTRRHRVILGPRPEVPPGAPMTVDADTGAHWRPHRGGALLAWARPEPPGPPAWPVLPDPAFPAVLLGDPDGVGRLARFWRELAPRLRPAEIELVAGQYDITPDHRPLIGPSRAVAGLWYHLGYSGHGVMGAPAGARLLADLVVGRVTAAENPFRPDRFGEGARVGEGMVL